MGGSLKKLCTASEPRHRCRRLLGVSGSRNRHKVIKRDICRTKQSSGSNSTSCHERRQSSEQRQDTSSRAIGRRNATREPLRADGRQVGGLELLDQVLALVRMCAADDPPAAWLRRSDRLQHLRLDSSSVEACIAESAERDRQQFTLYDGFTLATRCHLAIQHVSPSCPRFRRLAGSGRSPLSGQNLKILTDAALSIF
jgi:hypothetical protein